MSSGRDYTTDLETLCIQPNNTGINQRYLSISAWSFVRQIISMLCSVARSAARSSSSLFPVLGGVRCMALSGVKGFSDHETAVENMYFSKEDERLLGKLLSKMKKQTQVTDVSAATESAVAEEAALRNIVAKYKISKEDFEALLDWKHAHY